MDRTTFDMLVLDHIEPMHRFAIRLTGDPGAAEEVMQNALVKAMRGWRTFEGRSAFSTWLMRIVIHAFRDHLAAARRGCDPLPEAIRDARAVDPADRAAAGEVGELVARLVSALPPRQREVLVLIVYEQLSAAQAAGVLGISRQNVRTNLHYAKQRLRDQLADYMTEGRL